MLVYDVAAKVHILDVTETNPYSKMEILEDEVSNANHESCTDDFTNLNTTYLDDAIQWDGLKDGDIININFHLVVHFFYDSMTGEWDAEWDITKIKQEKVEA
ncbi:hypothetical protein HWC21_gp073 [Vibrio phage VAP7]|uniref:Uncharacterized protein n=1 Tax=Vibrio phage VAP7 TaxID=2584487 RepID=A0A4Y5TW47_9CAUD|nr:hypothetical protein [Bacillus subtilis]YP_009845729.1 hypothetical protein HWC21_gp073 [Vibrio phage VAP7]QDB73255.1 hypothetical protein [Vibrio phage VAP7]UFD98060.1 hypothetical protein [Vibrio phage BX-1]